MASGPRRPKRSQMKPEAMVPSTFMAPMMPSAVEAWNSVKLCSRACGMKWVSTMPFEVYPHTKKVDIRSQNWGNCAASTIPTRPARRASRVWAAVSEAPVAP